MIYVEKPVLVYAVVAQIKTDLINNSAVEVSAIEELLSNLSTNTLNSYLLKDS